MVPATTRRRIVDAMDVLTADMTGDKLRGEKGGPFLSLLGFSLLTAPLQAMCSVLSRGPLSQSAVETDERAMSSTKTPGEG